MDSWRRSASAEDRRVLTRRLEPQSWPQKSRGEQNVPQQAFAPQSVPLENRHSLQKVPARQRDLRRAPRGGRWLVARPGIAALVRRCTGHALRAGATAGAPATEPPAEFQCVVSKMLMVLSPLLATAKSG